MPPTLVFSPYSKAAQGAPPWQPLFFNQLGAKNPPVESHEVICKADNWILVVFFKCRTSRRSIQRRSLMTEAEETAQQLPQVPWSGTGDIQPGHLVWALKVVGRVVMVAVVVNALDFVAII